MTRALVQLENVDVALDGQIILRDLTWQLKPGEHWVILGGNGSGKSTLMKLIRGEVWPAPGCRGRRIYRLDGAEQSRTAIGIKEQIGCVSPELQEHYLQQAWTLTGLKVIHSGFLNTGFVQQKPTRGQAKFARQVIALLKIEPLLQRNVQQLSTGELRKILIARALVGAPRILICDEICDGLDAPSRIALLAAIEQVARAGTQILFTTHRREEILPAMTHGLILENGKIAWQGVKSALPAQRKPRAARTNKVAAPSAEFDSAKLSLPENSRCLIQIEKADVFLDRRRVLRDISWEIRDNQNWVVFGPNGAGKSTLLKLAFGDLHPALGANIKRFTFTAQNTIWDVRRKIGYVSPDMQANYRALLTGAQMVASGFFSSIGLMDKPSRRQRMKVSELVNSFQLTRLADRSILSLSYGEFRKLLLLRALVNDPEILICDEPFDGLDEPAKAEFAETLERVAHLGTRLIIVTHHLGDLPNCITHGLLLLEGRIVCQGKVTAVRNHSATRQLFGLS